MAKQTYAPFWKQYSEKDLKTRKSFCLRAEPLGCVMLLRVWRVCVCVVLFFLSDSQLTPWLEA